MKPHLRVLHRPLGHVVASWGREQLVFSVGEGWLQLLSSCCGSLLRGTTEDFSRGTFTCSLCDKPTPREWARGTWELPSLRAAVDCEGELLLALLAALGREPLEALVAVAEVQEELATLREQLTA